MKKNLFILGLFTHFLSLSQNDATLKGTLINEIGYIVSDANISVVGSSKGVTTDSLGKFKLSVPSGNVKIRISHSSYQQKNMRYFLKPGETKTIYPVFKFRVLPEYTVVTKSTDETMLTLIKVDDQLFATPSGNFEARLSSEIGVAMNNELSSGYNVRGGNFEENLIYVNDIEIYRPFLASSGQQE